MVRPKGAKDWNIVVCTACKGKVNRENAKYIEGFPYGANCYKRIILQKEKLAEQGFGLFTK